MGGLSMLIKTHTPDNIEIKTEKLSKDKYKLYYSESFSKDVPIESLKATVGYIKDSGVLMSKTIKLKGRTISYTLKGGRRIFNGIAMEILAQSEFNNITITDMIVMASLGLIETHRQLNLRVKCPDGKECIGSDCVKFDDCKEIKRIQEEAIQEGFIK
jgi:hypothetical protein